MAMDFQNIRPIRFVESFVQSDREQFYDMAEIAVERCGSSECPSVWGRTQHNIYLCTEIQDLFCNVM